ncbi:MAG: hypothetical protein ACXV7D_13110 [Thermoanaerobaculia bacterium]
MDDEQGHIFCPVWFIDVRCACDQAAYLTEGESPPGVSDGFPEGRPEVRQRLPDAGPAKSAGQVRHSSHNNRNGRSAKPEESRTRSTKKDPSLDLLANPLREQVQALRPDSPPPAEDNPAENMRVITKIAHHVLDLWPGELAVDHGEAVESIKRHCAVLHIAYPTRSARSRAVAVAVSLQPEVLNPIWNDSRYGTDDESHRVLLLTLLSLLQTHE